MGHEAGRTSNDEAAPEDTASVGVELNNSLGFGSESSLILYDADCWDGCYSYLSKKVLDLTVLLAGNWYHISTNQKQQDDVRRTRSRITMTHGNAGSRWSALADLQTTVWLASVNM